MSSDQRSRPANYNDLFPAQRRLHRARRAPAKLGLPGGGGQVLHGAGIGLLLRMVRSLTCAAKGGAPSWPCLSFSPGMPVCRLSRRPSFHTTANCSPPLWSATTSLWAGTAMVVPHMSVPPESNAPGRSWSCPDASTAVRSSPAGVLTLPTPGGKGVALQVGGEWSRGDDLPGPFRRGQPCTDYALRALGR